MMIRLLLLHYGADGGQFFGGALRGVFGWVDVDGSLRQRRAVVPKSIDEVFLMLQHQFFIGKRAF